MYAIGVNVQQEHKSGTCVNFCSQNFYRLYSTVSDVDVYINLSSVGLPSSNSNRKENLETFSASM